MQANDMKKGQKGTLYARNGWPFEILCNKKGLIRTAMVYGDYTEARSIYVHDIYSVNMPDGTTEPIELTAAQQKQSDMIKSFGF
tara:strand:+ start:51 stop:302 length:252 start_codon:yes stop_codon:yes gene_type:complete